LLEGIASQASVALQNVQHYELAMVDGLTRLYVRRYFDARLDEEFERSRRFETMFSVAMVDIDNFKQLNDTYGHEAGDIALSEVARVLLEEMRGIDTAARYGGEEFALVLPRTSLTEAYSLAERIRVRLSELRIAVPGRIEPLAITASFGIAAHPESGAESVAELLRLADRALYRAKQMGKDRVELYWSEDQDSAASVKPV
ncbi:MAG: GGDEF domain-containing protein, partial [Deltaproteobacteria bacterium]|nr:GGDEF domain-containing protein [Deltaproteobacteria bacterium]